jgi:hypothetical protein
VLSFQTKHLDGKRHLAKSEHRGKLHPTALEKGFEVPIKDNGYPDFKKYRHKKNGKGTLVVIEMTGSRSSDFSKANKLAGFDEKPKNYTWHHTEYVIERDGKIYNVMELVETEAHDAARHSGGVAIYKAMTGDENAYKDK